MHHERAALLRAIAANPDDDAVRLVYADWLEEHGDDTARARAVYIRLAIEKARLPRKHPRRVRLQGEMNGLLRTHYRHWFPWAELLHFAGRHRGFTRHARGPAAAFNTHSAALFAAEPVTSLYLEPGGDGFAEFASSPLLARLRTLDLPEDSVPVGGMRQLVAAGHITALRKLNMSYWRSTPAEFAELCRARWPNLRVLSFLRCGLDDSAPVALKDLDAPRLTRLGLNAEDIGARGLRRLIEIEWVRNLTHLSLELMQGSFVSERIGEILDHPRLANLRYLDLSTNPLARIDIRVLARSEHFGQLRTLNLSDTRVGAEGLLDLLQSRSFPRIRHLSYSGDGPGFADLTPGAGALVAAESWLALRTLYLNGDWLGDAGFRWLLSSGVLEHVRELWVSGNLSGSALIELFAAPVARSLVTLELGNNPLGALDGLPGAVELPRLRQFGLQHCELGDAGAVALVRALRAPNLRELTLYQNDLGNATVAAIASNPSFARLENLSLSYHSAIDDDGARVLVEAPYLNRLETLQLFETNVSTRALHQLRKRFRNVRSD
jgi:uncharacterized protein (TIGR02996 family)